MVAIPNIVLFDLGLGIFYLIIVFYFAYLYQQQKIVSYPEYRYFLIGLTAKIIGAFAFVVISIYYYKEGDTFLYFQVAEDLRVNLFVNYSETFQTLFTPYSDLVNVAFNPLEKYNYYYERETNWIFGRVVFFFNLLSFGSYFVTSILISTVSFLGLWLGYRSMCRLYLSVSKLLLIPFFLVPTALIWSSGILKDTLIIGTIGMLLYAFSNIFIFRKRLFLNFILIAFGVVVLQLLKPILVLILLPCLTLWGFLYLTKPMKLSLGRFSIRILIMIGIFLTIYSLNNTFVGASSKYNLDNLITTAEGFHSFHSLEVFSEGKSVYDIGEVEFTGVGLIKKIPRGILATFFRPYPWEVNNFPLILGTIESVLLLIMIVWVVIDFIVGLIKSKLQLIKVVLSNYELIFMLSFSIIFASIAGITSYNFGALSRYKIPAILFFLISLIIIIHESELFNKSNIVTKLASKIIKK
jgi:hypothetical protein